MNANACVDVVASARMVDFPLSWEEWPLIIVLKGITSCLKSCDGCLRRLQCSVLCHQLKSFIHNIDTKQKKEVLNVT